MSETPIRDLPPRAKLVYEVLEYNGPQTQKQFVDQTLLSSRTVRYALDQLEDAGIVVAEIHIPDARQRMYSLQNDVRGTNRRTSSDRSSLVGASSAKTTSSPSRPSVGWYCPVMIASSRSRCSRLSMSYSVVSSVARPPGAASDVAGDAARLACRKEQTEVRRA